jgi:ubiquinone/menaquinone biosynthesis C-methylase UbiE
MEARPVLTQNGRIARERIRARTACQFRREPSVIAAAQVQSGSRVLDISTGTGEAAVAALPVIGPSGILVGADISREMVRSAVQRVNDTRFLPVAADGQELPFRNGSFDAVICQLGLQFFPDPARGLAEFRRVLRPAGKACVCVISNPDRAPMWGFLAEAIARRLPEMRDILMASFALADAKRVEDLFSAAGFTNVGVTREVRGGTVKGLDEYWKPILAGTGSIPKAYHMLEEREQGNVRDSKLSQFVVGNELHMSVEILIGHGQVDVEEDRPAKSTLHLPASIDPRLEDIVWR